MHIRDPLLHSLCPIKWPNVLYSAFTGPLVTHEFRRHVALSGKTLGSRGPLLHRIEVKTSWSSHPNQYPTSTQSNEGQRTANQAFSEWKLIIYKNCDRIPLSRERNMSEYIYIANPEKEKKVLLVNSILWQNVCPLGDIKSLIVLPTTFLYTTVAPAFSFGPNWGISLSTTHMRPLSATPSIIKWRGWKSH